MSIKQPLGFCGRFHTDDATRAAYSEGAGPYRILPMAVAVPADHDDLARLIATAIELSVPLTPRGAGSGMPGGNVGPGVVVDMHEFNRPLFVSAARTANVAAAVTYAEVNRAANRFNLRLPPDPSSGKFCTIAGMVATNAAGARSLHFGSIRKWVRGVEFVSGTGDRGWIGRKGMKRNPRKPTNTQQAALTSLKAVGQFERTVAPSIQRHAETIRDRSPKTSKNSAGYALGDYLSSGDLVDIIIGSEGTLGFITRVELDLALTAGGESTVLATIPDLSVLGEVVGRLKELSPAAIEFMDRTLLHLAEPGDFPIDTSDAVVIAEFERGSTQDAADTAKQAADRLADLCPHVTIALEPDARAAIWAMRRSASSRLARLPVTRRNLQVNEDGCVPTAKLGSYLKGVRESALRNDIEIVAFGHAGDGHVHVNALVDTTESNFEHRLSALARETAELAIDMGGTPSGEHGDGRLRTPYLERLYGSEIVGLFRSVKEVFDPHGILNPGVIVSNGSGQELHDLKVGPDSARIPADIGAKLLDIERLGRWDTPKFTLPEL